MGFDKQNRQCREQASGRRKPPGNTCESKRRGPAAPVLTAKPTGTLTRPARLVVRLSVVFVKTHQRPHQRTPNPNSKL
jgi:hypothetical protein